MTISTRQTCQICQSCQLSTKHSFLACLSPVAGADLASSCRSIADRAGSRNRPQNCKTELLSWNTLSCNWNMRSLFILRCPSRLSHKAKSIHTSSVRYQKQVPSFTYSLATSFHGKTPKKTTTAFEPSSDIAHWRDSVLEGSSWPVDAGEDFLFTKRLADEVLLGVCDGVVRLWF